MRNTKKPAADQVQPPRKRSGAYIGVVGVPDEPGESDVEESPRAADERAIREEMTRPGIWTLKVERWW